LELLDLLDFLLDLLDLLDDTRFLLDRLTFFDDLLGNFLDDLLDDLLTALLGDLYFLDVRCLTFFILFIKNINYNIYKNVRRRYKNILRKSNYGQLYVVSIQGQGIV
jgi:hypothetical protein